MKLCECLHTLPASVLAKKAGVTDRQIRKMKTGRVAIPEIEITDSEIEESVKSIEEKNQAAILRQAWYDAEKHLLQILIAADRQCENNGDSELVKQHDSEIKQAMQVRATAMAVAKKAGIAAIWNPRTEDIQKLFGAHTRRMQATVKPSELLLQELEKRSKQG